MDQLDLTLPSPAENLALDEALLLAAEEGQGGEILRFWSSPLPFVVVGVGAKVRAEVYGDACQQDGVPVLRRCSGGGTVLQGPGCLNYALVLRIPSRGPLASITGANQFIMERHAAALSALVERPVRVAGHTDLVVGKHKVSGNAQRRLRHHLLFHGTVLLGLDLDRVTRLLRPPPREPAYRASRPHAAFITNLNLAPARVKEAWRMAWGVPGMCEASARAATSERHGVCLPGDGANLEAIPSPAAERVPGFTEASAWPAMDEMLRCRVATLVETRYGRFDWNLRL